MRKLVCAALSFAAVSYTHLDVYKRQPICNPGLASINAALNPASTNYLYYALDTETGTHRFFTSYSEFEAFTATQDYTGN